MNELSDKIWNLIDLINMMVRLLDKLWNQFLPDLYKMQSSLERIGLFEEDFRGAVTK